MDVLPSSALNGLPLILRLLQSMEYASTADLENMRTMVRACLRKEPAVVDLPHSQLLHGAIKGGDVGIIGIVVAAGAKVCFSSHGETQVSTPEFLLDHCTSRCNDIDRKVVPVVQALAPLLFTNCQERYTQDVQRSIAVHLGRLCDVWLDDIRFPGCDANWRLQVMEPFLAAGMNQFLTKDGANFFVGCGFCDTLSNTQNLDKVLPFLQLLVTARCLIPPSLLKEVLCSCPEEEMAIPLLHAMLRNKPHYLFQEQLIATQLVYKGWIKALKLLAASGCLRRRSVVHGLIVASGHVGTTIQHAAFVKNADAVHILLEHTQPCVISTARRKFVEGWTALPSLRDLVMGAENVFKDGCRELVMTRAASQEAVLKAKQARKNSSAAILAFLSDNAATAPAPAAAFGVTLTGRGKKDVSERLGQLCLEYLGTEDENTAAGILRRLQQCFAAGLNEPLGEDGTSFFSDVSFLSLVKEYPYSRVTALLCTALPHCVSIGSSLVAKCLILPINEEADVLPLLEAALQHRPSFLLNRRHPVIATWCCRGYEVALRRLLASGVEGLRENAAVPTLNREGGVFMGNAASLAAFKGRYKILRLLTQYVDVDLDAVCEKPVDCAVHPLASASTLLHVDTVGAAALQKFLADDDDAVMDSKRKPTPAKAVKTPASELRTEDFKSLEALVEEEEAEKAATVARAQAAKARKKKGGKKVATEPVSKQEDLRPSRKEEEEEDRVDSEQSRSIHAGAGSAARSPALVALVAGTEDDCGWNQQKISNRSAVVAPALPPIHASMTSNNVVASIDSASAVYQSMSSAPEHRPRKDLSSPLHSSQREPQVKLSAIARQPTSSDSGAVATIPRHSSTSTAPDAPASSSTAAGPIELAKERHARANAAKLGLRPQAPYSHSPLSEEEQMEKAIQASLAEAATRTGYRRAVPVAVARAGTGGSHPVVSRQEVARRTSSDARASYAASDGGAGPSLAREVASTAEGGPSVAAGSGAGSAVAASSSLPAAMPLDNSNNESFSSSSSGSSDQCCICFESFSWSRAADRVTLHDDHSFCRDCLSCHIDNVVRKAVGQGKEVAVIECPLCRKEFALDHARAVCAALQQQLQGLELPAIEERAEAAEAAVEPAAPSVLEDQTDRLQTACSGSWKRSLSYTASAAVGSG
jgi:hypothetical protein